MAILSRSKDLTVFIGRFSPFHNGHGDVLERALNTSKAVLVLVGSSGQARTTKNPFTFEERKDMIEAFASSLGKRSQLIVLPIYDHPYNDNAWIRGVQDAVDTAKTALVDIIGLNPTVYLTGADRDRSTWYLNAFGNFFKMDILTSTPHGLDLSATQVRSILFDGTHTLGDVRSILPSTTFERLKSFVNDSVYDGLVQEYQYIEDYKSRWNIPDRIEFSARIFDVINKIDDPIMRDELSEAFAKLIKLAPYAPTFVTTDACVIQSGHVLVNVRDNFPGKGLWALPGGFLEQDEKLIDGAVRELIEETRIELSKAQLYGAIKSKETFDHPDRSLRGRTITHCYLFVLDNTKPLPKTKPQLGEVKKVMWLPIAEALRRREMWFEDHHSMLSTMYGRLPAVTNG